MLESIKAFEKIIFNVSGVGIKWIYTNCEIKFPTTIFLITSVYQHREWATQKFVLLNNSTNRFSRVNYDHGKCLGTVSYQHIKMHSSISDFFNGLAILYHFQESCWSFSIKTRDNYLYKLGEIISKFSSIRELVDPLPQTRNIICLSFGDLGVDWQRKGSHTAVPAKTGSVVHF